MVYCLCVTHCEAINYSVSRGGFRWGVGTLFLSSSGIRPLHQSKGSLFDIILGHPFMADQPQNFLKAPTYTNFNVERAPLKSNFFSQNVPKSTEERFFGLFFFKNLPALQLFQKMYLVQFLVDLFLFLLIDTNQVDLSLFRDECPCLKGYSAGLLYQYFAYNVDSCMVYCLGITHCEAINYSVSRGGFRGWGGLFLSSFSLLLRDSTPSPIKRLPLW